MIDVLFRSSVDPLNVQKYECIDIRIYVISIIEMYKIIQLIPIQVGGRAIENHLLNVTQLFSRLLTIVNDQNDYIIITHDDGDEMAWSEGM